VGYAVSKSPDEGVPLPGECQTELLVTRMMCFFFYLFCWASCSFVLMVNGAAMMGDVVMRGLEEYLLGVRIEDNLAAFRNDCVLKRERPACIACKLAIVVFYKCKR